MCIFIGNSARNGGGIHNNTNSNATITNCTLVGNTASYGGGFYNLQGSPVITNCIFWNNTASVSYPQIRISAGSPVITFCCVQGGYSGTGNIISDPNFVDAAGGNLRLTRGSGCIDAGKNAAVAASITTDMNGWARFIEDLCTVNSGSGTAPLVDMGAYEFLPADIDGSGGVDLEDFSRVAAHWQETGSDVVGDMNCDGAVEFDDMTMLVGWWLEGA